MGERKLKLRMILGLKCLYLTAFLTALIQSNVARCDDQLIKSKELSNMILESRPSERNSYLYDRHQGVSRKLDWASDMMVDRNDIFMNQSQFDDIADDQSYGRRMLRRSLGKEVSRLAQSSELKSFYNRVSRAFKETQDLLSIRRDAGTVIKTSSSGKSNGGTRILSLGFDSSNQFSPSVKVYEKLKVSYEPFSDKLIAQVGWDF